MFKKQIGIALSAVLMAGSAIAANAEVKIINRSSHIVYYIYTSPHYADEYGSRDLLRNGTIRPGYNRIVDFNVPDAKNECLQDIQAKTDTGRKWEKRIDVCTATEWTLYD